MSQKAKEKREILIKSAIQLLQEEGINALTLDAVAKKANTSKGGLLYHFPNKQALIEGVVQDIYEKFSEEFFILVEKETKNRYTKAFIELCFNDLSKHSDLYVGSMVVPFLENKQVQDIYQNILDYLKKDELDETTINLIRLTIDGVYYNKFSTIAPLTAVEMNEIKQKLYRLAEGE